MTNLLERFERGYEPEPNSGCWLWAGVRNSLGYGLMNKPGPWRNNKRKMAAYRVAHELFKGPIPPGLSVLHRCDNPPCVNPAHLYAGTQRQNMLDAKARGRHATGERNGQAKLSAVQVAQIRAHQGSIAVIAREFGVSESLIRLIRRGERWIRVSLR